MAPDVMIEQRLAAVEEAVAEIQRRLAAAPARSSHWVQRFTGAFKDEPAFADIVAYGQAFRSADRPPQDSQD